MLNVACVVLLSQPSSRDLDYPLWDVCVLEKNIKKNIIHLDFYAKIYWYSGVIAFIRQIPRPNESTNEEHTL